MRPDGRLVSEAADAPAVAAWAAVYEGNATRLLQLAAVLVGPSDAHDLVADATLRAVTSPHWSSVDVPAAYLTRAVVNLAHDRRRQADQRHRREQRAARLAGPITTSVSGFDHERALVVRAALGTLSPTQAAVVFLHYWNDLTLAEVAAHLDLRLGTVHRHLDRAKKRLEAALAHPGAPS